VEGADPGFADQRQLEVEADRASGIGDREVLVGGTGLGLELCFLVCVVMPTP
jgi:hypothetical protein